MNFTLGQIFVLGVAYLASLFAVAWLAEKNWLAKKLTNHPITITLALASYASAWAFFGSFALAAEFGWAFLAYYLGISLVFALAPRLILPLLRLTQAYQLSSVADLLAFRFRSRWVGLITSLGLLVGSLPLIALQIQAIGDVIHLLTNQSSPYKLALVFCLVIAVFTMLFGAQNLSLKQQNTGLIFALAFESLVKLLAFILLAVACLVIVFGGFAGLETWLTANPQALENFNSTNNLIVWPSLLLIFFASAFSMPHIFHIIFVENFTEAKLLKAGRYLPIYLLVLALPIPFIYWAYLALNSTLPVEYASLALGGAWGLVVLIFSLAAASGTIILLTLALAPMVVNHVILAVYQPPANFDLYFWLVRVRRLLISLIIASAYVVYLIFSPNEDLVNLGLIAFIACIQFLPASLASVFWPTANRKGLFTGLAFGFGLWGIGLTHPEALVVGFYSTHTVGFWLALGLIATLANSLVFIGISSATQASPEEKSAAKATSLASLKLNNAGLLKVKNLTEFTEQLSLALGNEVAHHQVQLALNKLDFTPVNLDNKQLALLREQLEINLSSLMGAGVAQKLVDSYLAWENFSANNLLNEKNLDYFSHRLKGTAKEIDNLRIQHRQTLMHLPLGICTLGKNQEIMLWNPAIEKLTGLAYSQVVGKTLNQLPEPWQSCFSNFLTNKQLTSAHRQPLETSNPTSWLGLHKAQIAEAEAYLGTSILLVEDQSHLQQLENQLIHKERLASIGQLAAGVAHEIGNPVTGISSLAQNLNYDAEDPEVVKQTAEQILQLTQRITDIVQSLINFSYSGSQAANNHEVFRVKDLFNQALNIINLSAKGRNRNFILECPEELYLAGDEQRLTQVLVNLLTNARDATGNQDKILCLAFCKQNEVIIEIHDEGAGLTSKTQQQLFEPFFTTKEVGKGTGLGLALVYSIIQEHKGSIIATSPSARFNQGSCFSLSFPLPSNPAFTQETPT